MKRMYSTLSFIIIFSFLLSSCSGIASIGKRVVVTIIYGSEKQEWLEPLVQQFNAQNNKTDAGTIIEVQATPMGSIESVSAIIEGSLQPTVWSPASSIYIPVANDEWQKTHSEPLITGDPRDLVLSPVVIAMWKPMAEALGYPQQPLGWGDIGKLAISTQGWEAFGYPEWGSFKFGHTHPEYSNSGIVAIIAQAYAGAGKQRDLTLADLQRPDVRDFMTDVQSSIIHYGTSTGFFANRMFENGPSYLSAAVIYENLVVAQESKRLAGESYQLPVVAIYPKEGTFWANHPYVVLNAPWVTSEQREAAILFESYLLDRPQQQSAIQLGFRPADPGIPLTAPLDIQHGVDPSQPKTILQIPTAAVIHGIEEFWKEVKKPVDLFITFDTSSSMGGKKISTARNSLVQFIQLLSDRDHLGVVLFHSKVITLTPLSYLGAKRQEISTRVSGIVEGGNTSLYDGVAEAYNQLLTDGDPKHIRAIVVLSDGQDTASQLSLQGLLAIIGQNSEDGGNAIKVFTIGYGSDADADILKSIADATGGKYYEGTPENIQKIYSEIATFF